MKCKLELLESSDKCTLSYPNKSIAYFVKQILYNISSKILRLICRSYREVSQAPPEGNFHKAYVSPSFANWH